MKTKILSFIILMLTFSCSQDEQQLVQDKPSKFEKVGITKIEVVSSSNQIFNNLTKTDYLKT
jgi:hypothetical protein